MKTNTEKFSLKKNLTKKISLQKDLIERASCAVGGFFTDESQDEGQNENISLVLEFLEKLPHRGGQIFVSQGEEVIKVGDGAGVSCDIDWRFYNKLMGELGIEKPDDKPCGIGNFFLPNDAEARAEAIQKISAICKEFGVQMLRDAKRNVWREIPFESGDSRSAKDLKLQKFRQCFLAPNKNMSVEDFEKVLLQIQAAIEDYSHQLNEKYKIEGRPMPRLAVASISSEMVIYKGMILPEEVKYFSDLTKSNPRNIVYHIRQSTNTSPSPGNAQPFRAIGHNGELNSVEGNADKNHKAPRGFSDSRTFDEQLRELILEGKTVMEAITMLMPPPLTGNQKVDAMLKDIKAQDLEYNGPAHMVFAFGGIKGAKMDSSALRPSRYLIAKNKAGKEYLYVGSEDMFSDEQVAQMGLEVVERDMLCAGEMIILENGKVKKNQQILEDLAQNYQKTCSRFEKVAAVEMVIPDIALDLGNRESEIAKYQMLPLLGGATNKGAMGDDTNPLKTDENDLPTLADHFKQKFSQVSSPPIDPEKELESFTLEVFLGDKTANPKMRHLWEVESPILKLGELEALKIGAGNEAAEIDLSFDLFGLSISDREDKQSVLALMRSKIKAICEDVEAQILAGKSIIILDGTQVSPSKMGLPDILVLGAVHSHLHKKGLDKKASLVVNSAQAESAHHISVLLSLGASAVNPVGFYDFAAKIAKRDGRSNSARDDGRDASEGESAQEKYQKYCQNVQHGLEKAHLSTMAKYGITSAATYSGARLVETLTLNLGEIDDQDPACLGNAFKSVKFCSGFMGRFGVDNILTDAVIAHQRRHNNKIITSGHFAYSPHGVNHTYNPTVVRAIRNATTEYRAKRDLSKNLQQKAEALAGKLDLVVAPDFDFEQHKIDLEKERQELGEDIKQKNRAITQIRNQNDKFLNSLFFIDGIARQLGAIIKGDQQKEEALLKRLQQESQTLTSSESASRLKDIEDLAEQNLVKADRLLIRQFMSVVSKSGTAMPVDNFMQLCKKYRNGEINDQQFKAELFAKAGYDSSEIEKVEKWAKLVAEEKSVEAAEIFANLSDHNKNRIEGVYRENEKNQKRIALLNQELEQLSSDQIVGNILFEIAGRSDDENYAENVRSKIEDLKTQALWHNFLPSISDGVFDAAQMDAHQIDKPFADAMEYIVQNKRDYRVTIADHLEIDYLKAAAIEVDSAPVQLVCDIAANHIVTGGMSHGALTKSAHNDIAKAAQLIGGRACTGEGGKPEGQQAKVVQIASGRFGINPEYFADADTVEIKVVQGAKPGEGGMLPAGKVSIEIAAARGATVGVGLISPPPHHDIYSIEDLQELIKDLKEFKPGIKVAVKLCASEGIDQIAIGVAKSGADIINIAGGSGGTGAAAVDSIKSTGLPAEVGLVMVNQALTKAGIRDLVKLQVSGFPNTPEGLIIMSILGGDVLESGTTDLMLLGCDMHRKCNIPGACVPGITNNEEGYQGNAQDLALYKLNMAKAVQDLLKKLGVNHLKDLRGRVDLLSAQHLQGKVSDEFIESLLAESAHPQLPIKKLEEYRKNANNGSNQNQYLTLENQGLASAVLGEDQTVFDIGKVDVTNRAFGAKLAFEYYQQLEKKSADHITIKTRGVVGQSYGAFNANGFCLEHTGSAQDGFGKSMSGGVLVVKQPESERHLTNSTYVGNAAFYGASAGKAFIAGVGNRCAVLMKGATLVVNGKAGDYACEYMTSGSFLALGKVGRNFGSGMSGGVAVLYNQEKDLEKSLAEDVRLANDEEAKNYYDAIKELLEEDYRRTGDIKIAAILKNFEVEKSNFKIVIPVALNKINSLKKLEEVEQSFALRHNVKKQGPEAISIFERVWLKSKRAELESEIDRKQKSLRSSEDVIEMCSKLAPIVADHIDHMTQYAPVAARIVGGLGVTDQVLSDDINELMDELFSQGAKCRGCDASSCGGEKTPAPKQAVSGCPINKEPNSINSILKGEGEFVSLSKEQRAFEAFKKQIEQSPFPGFTGAACPAPCQDACTQGVANEGDADAVKIRRIELLLHKIAKIKGWYDRSIYGDLNVFGATMPAINQKKIMIIGSGPAALEAAYHLAKAGHQVEIFEKSDHIGGLLVYGIPDHKIPKTEIVGFYIEKLRDMGVNFHTETEIDIHQVQTDYPHYDLYLDSRGLVAKPFDNAFPKTNVAEGGNHSMAMDFLTYCNQYFADKKRGEKKSEDQHPFNKFNLGKTIILLGSGDTATDVIDTIARLNGEFEENDPRKVELVVINRQPQESHKAKPGAYYPMKRDKSSNNLQEEAIVQYEISPNKFKVDENGKITGVCCDQTYCLAPEFARTIRPKGTAISEVEYGCDSVITAIGFELPELPQYSMAKFGAIQHKAIIPIGDLATESGFVEDGKALIVSSQANAKKVADEFLIGLETQNKKTPSASPALRLKKKESVENLKEIGEEQGAEVFL